MLLVQKKNGNNIYKMTDIKKECEIKNSFQKLEDIDLQIGHSPGYDEGMEGEAVTKDTEYGKSNRQSRINRRKRLEFASKPKSSRNFKRDL